MADSINMNRHHTSAGEDCSIDTLVQRIEEFQAFNQRDAVDRLAAENATPVRIMETCGHEASRQMAQLWTVVRQACGALHEALMAYAREDAAADQRWLTFWGIPTDGSLPPCPGGWI